MKKIIVPLLLMFISCSKHIDIKDLISIYNQNRNEIIVCYNEIEQNYSKLDTMFYYKAIDSSFRLNYNILKGDTRFSIIPSTSALIQEYINLEIEIKSEIFVIFKLKNTEGMYTWESGSIIFFTKGINQLVDKINHSNTTKVLTIKELSPNWYAVIWIQSVD